MCRIVSGGGIVDQGHPYAGSGRPSETASSQFGASWRADLIAADDTRNVTEALDEVVRHEPAMTCYSLETTPTIRRTPAERLPDLVAVAVYEFMTGPLLDARNENRL